MSIKQGVRTRLDRLEAAAGAPGTVHVIADRPLTEEEAARLVAESGRTRGVLVVASPELTVEEWEAEFGSKESEP